MMKQMNKEHEALEALIDGYPRILGTDEQALLDRVNFVYEITTLAVRLWSECFNPNPPTKGCPESATVHYCAVLQ